MMNHQIDESPDDEEGVEDDLFGDDFDDDGFEDNFDSFDGDGKGGPTLGDLWRDNPLVKIGAIAGGVILLILLFVLFGGEKEEPERSMVAGGGGVGSAPGTDEASPTYIEAVEEVNEARVEEAIREGTSALPTPIEPPIGRLSVPEEDDEQEDPLQRWRRLQQERLEREMRQASVIQAAPEEPQINPEMIEAMSSAMSTQMQAILEAQSQPQRLASVEVTGTDFLEKLASKEAEEAARQAGVGDEGDEAEGGLLLPAAEMAYAQLLTEANSDVPGPVLARIMSGPLKGGKLLGDFSVQKTYITLNFTTLVLDDETIGVDAVALDPDTTLPGMATEVDYRILKRVLLPMAAEFVEGAAEAIAQSGRTTVTIQGETVAQETQETDNEQEIASGIDQAGEELGEILDDIAGETEILVRIDAGTPMAILFLQDVREGGDDLIEAGVATR